ncbi:hypothetical protein JHK85_025309 [Glycine max]|nr:hypothetical protein JHK85_025309 [Glycine max]
MSPFPNRLSLARALSCYHDEPHDNGVTVVLFPFLSSMFPSHTVTTTFVTRTIPIVVPPWHGFPPSPAHSITAPRSHAGTIEFDSMWKRHGYPVLSLSRHESFADAPDAFFFILYEWQVSLDGILIGRMIMVDLRGRGSTLVSQANNIDLPPLWNISPKNPSNPNQDQVDLQVAHLYVLQNCLEVEPYLDIYENFLRELNPTASDAQLNQDIPSNFPTWFKQYGHQGWLPIMKTKARRRITDNIVSETEQEASYQDHELVGLQEVLEVDPDVINESLSMIHVVVLTPNTLPTAQDQPNPTFVRESIPTTPVGDASPLAPDDSLIHEYPNCEHIVDQRPLIRAYKGE